ncbi:MAG: phosphoribosylformylglycinamidine synthase subunit PurQ [Gemmatimonadota bacterium]|nr:phosphoribosylformylglycinamidine synthase subunit PurQ [Gemmatimonadota bacterium]MDQ8171334.1 phosphoribosylformylglycinamidine synthase subunit PurQ [Gemmatimonadota bacterium]
MKAGIVRFPGSNCDEDAFHAIADHLGQEAVYLWHKDHDLQGVDLVILPGGFSYGDYLRAGAIARFSPIMQEVIAFAKRGGPVLGICNGFQIACEAGLLPGALLRNASLRFVSAPVHLRVESIATRFTSQYHIGQVISIPVAHGDGRYTADADTLARLEGEGQVVFRYVNAAGETTSSANPNGSLRNIAGIVSAAGNVLGMMPHPERALDATLGSTDGVPLFASILESMLAEVNA